MLLGVLTTHRRWPRRRQGVSGVAIRGGSVRQRRSVLSRTVSESVLFALAVRLWLRAASVGRGPQPERVPERRAWQRVVSTGHVAVEKEEENVVVVQRLAALLA